jgi:hypothetical protein
VKDVRCAVLGHKWKKCHVEGSVFLRCVRCGREAEPGNYGGTLGAGF